jgi:hypothetical protein
MNIEKYLKRIGLKMYNPRQHINRVNGQFTTLLKTYHFTGDAENVHHSLLNRRCSVKIF